MKSKGVEAELRSTSRKTGSPPAMNWIVERMTNASPIDIRTSWRKPAPFARIGPHIKSSKKSPRSAVMTIAARTPRSSGPSHETLTTKAM